MKEFTIKSDYDDLDLSVLVATPADKVPVGIVQLVHGMTEHKERYIPFMNYLAERGFVSIIHDHRGHGKSLKSENDLGFFYKGGWKAMVKDVLKVQNYVKKEYPGLPVYLFGHSMGSMVVRSFVKRYDDSVAKLIVCGCPSYNAAAGAGLALAEAMSFIMGEHYRSGLLQYLSTGAFNKKFKKEGPCAWHTVNKDNVEKYIADPQCGFRFTANGYANLFSLVLDCYAKKDWTIKNPSLPILFISGGDDPCRLSDEKFYQAVNFMKERGYSDVSSRLYEGLRHEILNEKECETIFADVVEFCNR